MSATAPSAPLERSRSETVACAIPGTIALLAQMPEHDRPRQAAALAERVREQQPGRVVGQVEERGRIEVQAQQLRVVVGLDIDEVAVVGVRRERFGIVKVGGDEQPRVSLGDQVAVGRDPRRVRERDRGQGERADREGLVTEDAQRDVVGRDARRQHVGIEMALQDLPAGLAVGEHRDLQAERGRAGSSS